MTVTTQTKRWVSTSPYVKLTVTEITGHSGELTKARLSYKLEYISDSPASTAVAKAYSISIGGSVVKSGSYDINKKTGTTEITSGTVDVDRTKITLIIPCSVTFHFEMTWSGVRCAQQTASTTISTAAKAKYAINYNANGGSGAPSTQSKWHGESITLSSTKPTKAGHTFQGWGTSAADTTVDYAPGATYSANSAKTLYAIWEANTYTVAYDANGGTGAPSAQTKTHGVDLTISSKQPTRTNYTFRGWATTKNGSVAYNSGGSYTANAAITLYAVWQLSYVNPKIYNARAEWIAGQVGSGVSNLLTNSAGQFVSGTDSNYGYQNLLSSACSTLYLEHGKVYTLVFDWAVNWGGKTPVTNVEVRVWSGEEPGDFEDVSASMTIPNLSTTTSGTIHFPFTFNSGAYANKAGATIQAIYCSSKDALDGTTWTISNVKLVEGEVDVSELMPEKDSVSVVFNWETTNSNPTANLVFYNAGGSSVHTVSLGQLSGKSGRFEGKILTSESDALNIDTSYVIKITLSDGGGDTSSNVTLTGNTYTIDFLAGGKGVAFGGAASLEDTVHFQFEARFDKPVCGMVRGLGKLPKIAAGSDFNDYMDFGVWAVYGNADANAIKNMPPLYLQSGFWVGRAGILEVFSPTGEGMRSAEWSYIRQRFIPYSLSFPVMERDITRNASNVWSYGAWYQTSLSAKDGLLLYDNADGSTGTITLSRTSADFEYLEIFFTDNNGEQGGYTKIHKPYQKVVNLSIIEAGVTTTHIRRTSYTISGTTMTPDTTNAGFVKLTGSDVSHTTGTNYIKITRVVGRNS